MTHSLVDGILMECEDYDYRCLNVDANVIGVLPREAAQAVMVPTTLILRSLVRNVGKELPRVEPVVCMLFWGERAQSTTENLPSMHMFRGYLQGQSLHRRALHICTEKYFVPGTTFFYNERHRDFAQVFPQASIHPSTYLLSYTTL